MSFDRRITPLRDDLAAGRLRGLVDTPRFVDGVPAQINTARLDVFAAPDRAGGLTSQLLFGEQVNVYERDAATGLSWVQNNADDYVGYVETAGLGPISGNPTHRISSLGAQLYAEPRLKSLPLMTLPYGARVSASETAGNAGADFTKTPFGWIPAGQLTPIDQSPEGFVTEARRFLGTPYLWGGRSEQGLDCSALIQLPLWSLGHECPRDSDMQRALGTAVGAPDQVGDIICWRGHIGIVSAPNRLLHANAHHMAVTEEPLDSAMERIESGETGPVVAIRRLTAG